MADEIKGTKPEPKAETPKVEVEPEVKAAVREINAEATKTIAEAKATKPAVRRVAKKIKAKAAPKLDAPKPETKEDIMTKMDINNWFAAFELPTAEKVEELVADAGKKGEEFIAKSKSATEELAELTKANIEALVEAGKIATAGAKKLGEELVEDGREGFEKASTAMKSFAEAKNPAEVMELQARMVRENVDHAIAEAAALTEQWVKLVGDAMQPVSTRASLNAEKIKAMMA